ncbi:hypothetical protein AVEN_53381-1 [Araneus ventricosus]|uniref:Uncharacterized protein n=1 Tax=Araneus ventricosus TaxID=182803 RepID=A0A4Y2AA27_ARAVE|nr:hypothetical protein AVEN_53381-1 [Araneus ventricosus]
MKERRRREEQEYVERKRKEEYEERTRMEKYEERKRKDEMEFELKNYVLEQKISVAEKFKLKSTPAVKKIKGFGNQRMPALMSIGRIKADIEVDNVKAENISIYVVPDDARSVDLIIGRTWLDLSSSYRLYKNRKKSSHWIPGR